MTDESQVHEILNTWERRRSEGEMVNLSDLCGGDDLALLAEVRIRAAELNWVDGFLNAGELASNSKLMPPTQLGRYCLETLIGAGGFGQVWKAYDPVLERHVAVKMMRPERQGSALDATSVLAEARKVAALRHPNILAVHDSGQDGGCCFIVADWVDGSDLAHWLRQGPININDGVMVIAKVAGALACAHKCGVIHRDVKPHNILMDRQGEPFLADFGIAVSEEELSRDQQEVAGTPAYMSPEQADGSQRIDGRSDIYSLGIVLYEVLTGARPYEAETMEVLQRTVETLPITPPHLVTERAPRWLSDICMKAIARQPMARWESADEFQRQLLAKSHPNTGLQISAETSAIARVSSSPPFKRRRKKARATGRAALAILASIAVEMLLVALAVSSYQPRTNHQTASPTHSPQDTPYPLRKVSRSGPNPSTDLTVQSAGVGNVGGLLSNGAIANSLNMRFALIPSGQFLMGSPINEFQRQPDESQHLVSITRQFYMGDCEVTQDQYLRVVGSNPSQQRGNHLPVESVTWREAVAFCQLLSDLPEEKLAGRRYRLPTEAEWEYACRAGTTGLFGGRTLEGLGWCANDSGNCRIDSHTMYHSLHGDENRIASELAQAGCRTHPVRSKSPNAWGLFDMHGNVWEFCSDFYSFQYSRSATDPAGPRSGNAHVRRGGSYHNTPGCCRAARRGPTNVGKSHHSVGFRVVFDVK